MQREIRIDQLIDSHAVSAPQIWVLVLCMLLTMLDGFDTMALAVSLPAISQSWGLTPAEFAPALAATSAGAALGALLLAPLGDSIGRKTMVVSSSYLFAVFTLWIPFAQDVTTLTVMRFLAGIGFGLFLPNAIALVEELAPKHRREAAVMVMMSALPLGTIVGSLVGSIVIPRFGWSSIYVVGGAAALVLAIVATVALPESLKFLIARGIDPATIRSQLRKLLPDIDLAETTHLVTDDKRINRARVVELFAHGRTTITLLFWVAIVLEYFTLFLVILWLPSLLHAMHLPLERALQLHALFNVGSFFGTFLIGMVARAFGAYRTVAVSMLLGAASCALFSIQGNIVVLAVTCFTAGVFLFASFTAIAALVSEFYPVDIKATGLGWATGLARIAAMTSPLIVAAFMVRGATSTEVLLMPLTTLPLAAVAIVLISRQHRRQQQRSAQAEISARAEILDLSVTSRD